MATTFLGTSVASGLELDDGGVDERQNIQDTAVYAWSAQWDGAGTSAGVFSVQETVDGTNFETVTGSEKAVVSGTADSFYWNMPVAAAGITRLFYEPDSVSPGFGTLVDIQFGKKIDNAD